MSDEPVQLWQSSPLPWHRDVYDRFQKVLAQDRAPHALLISGAAGGGIEHLAALMAGTLLCHAPESRPCGSCDGCRMAQAGSHGDYRWLAPEAGKRALGIDAIRQAVSFIQQTPAFGERKVMVIAPAHAMTVAAANALLKTLEEPPGNGHLLLVSARPSDLPATVRSRCQLMQTPVPSLDQALAWLQAQCGGKDVAALTVALEAAEGEVMTAMQWLQNGDLATITELRNQLSALLDGTSAPGTTVASLKDIELDLILVTLLRLVEQRLRVSQSTDLKRKRDLFELHDNVRDWLSAVRRGVNLARDTLLIEIAQRCR